MNEGVVATSSWPFQVNLLRSKKAPIASVIPKEGATGWADTTMLHANAAASELRLQVARALALGRRPRATWRPGSAPCPPCPAACQGNELLGEKGCETNGAGNFDKIAFWRTPVADCGDGRECVPYHEWVTSYIAVIGGR